MTLAPTSVKAVTFVDSTIDSYKNLSDCEFKLSVLSSVSAAFIEASRNMSDCDLLVINSEHLLANREANAYDIIGSLLTIASMSRRKIKIAVAVEPHVDAKTVKMLLRLVDCSLGNYTGG